jgi:hypothetical protein
MPFETIKKSPTALTVEALNELTGKTCTMFAGKEMGCTFRDYCCGDEE